MDFDLIVSQPRWRILEFLARSPSSPVEISQYLGTSVAYVSQQLKFLEATGIIQKRKTGSSEKGKGRSLYSLSRDLLHVTALINHHPAKKLIYLTDHHERVLRIWLLENTNLHYYIEKLYWYLEDALDVIDGIFVDSQSQTIYVISSSSKMASKVKAFSIPRDKNIHCTVLTKKELLNIGTSVEPIYDPSSLLKGIALKGGNN